MENRSKAFDIVLCVLLSGSLFINLLFFTPVFIEQIQMGWGYPTRFEMLVLLFWFCQFFTLPAIVLGIISIIKSSIKNNYNILAWLNLSFTIINSILLILSIIFEFN